MLEMIVFAVTLVVAQTMSGFVMYKLMMKKLMNKDYLKKTSKAYMEIVKELAEEMEDEF